eukprot:6083126-Ditylum_brightwellii.AAC.1
MTAEPIEPALIKMTAEPELIEPELIKMTAEPELIKMRELSSEPSETSEMQISKGDTSKTQLTN